jgi:hypothetical protein
VGSPAAPIYTPHQPVSGVLNREEEDLSWSAFTDHQRAEHPPSAVHLIGTVDTAKSIGRQGTPEG